MNRVLVDARNITPQRAGIGRYAQSLMVAMSELESASDFHFSSLQNMQSPAQIGRFDVHGVKQKIGNVVDYLHAHRSINAIAKHISPSLFHSFFHITPRKLKVNCPAIITLHDTIWIDHAKSSQPTAFKAMTIKAFAKTAIPDSLRRADHVICVSDATAERATEWIPREKMTVIGHGVDSSFFATTKKSDLVRKYTHGGAKYICAIGNDKPYKNIRLLIDSFDSLNLPNVNLVLIGNCEGLGDHLDSLPNKNRIFLAGMLDDDALKRTLAHSALFVFPSLVEGFGLPILEAMAAGIPTVVSDLEPMRSVASGASYLFNPAEKDALSSAISEAMHPSVALELKRKGDEHARKQTWKKCAEKTLEVYRTLLE